MAERADAYHWRWCATALSFATFGLFGLVLGLTAFPLLQLAPIGRERRAAAGRRLVQACFRGFIGLMHRLRVLDYTFTGRELLGRPGQLVLANHPSLIDVVFLIAFSPGACCVVKASLWRNPFTAGVVRAAGFVPNFPTDTMIEGAAAALAAGRTLIMFPEGTRTRPGQPLQFHRGAASVAVRAARCVTPVLVRVEPPTLAKGEPWLRIPPRRPRFTLAVGQDVALRGFVDGRPAPLASRALNEALRAHFEAALAAAGQRRGG